MIDRSQKSLKITQNARLSIKNAPFLHEKNKNQPFLYKNELQKKEDSRDLFFSIDRLDQANSNMMH